MGILPIIFSFSGGSVADSYHANPLLSVHLCNNSAWANQNVNCDVLQKLRYDKYFADCDTRFSVFDTRFYVSEDTVFQFLMRHRYRDAVT